MKQLLKSSLIIITFGALLSFIPNGQTENTYTFTEQQALLTYNTNVRVKEMLSASNLPAGEVNKVIYNLDSINSVIGKQWVKFHPDTTKPKK